MITTGLRSTIGRRSGLLRIGVPLVVFLGLVLGSAGPAEAWLAVKVGGQFAGSLGASPDLDILGVKIPVPSILADAEAVEPGWSVAVEGDVPLGDHLALGGGVQYLGSRGLSNDLYPGYFSFLPVYGQAQLLLTGKGSKFRPYVKGQLGYNWFFVSDTFENTAEGNWDQLKNILENSSGGGIYWSAGLGAYIFKYVLLEVMYMECRGSLSLLDASLASLDIGGTYRNVAVYAGFHF